MAKHNQIESLALIFRVLGDQTRLRVLMALRRGEMNVSELCSALRSPQPTVSRHLSIMRMAGLVSSRREGKEIFYSLGNPANVKIIRGILAVASRA